MRPGRPLRCRHRLRETLLRAPRHRALKGTKVFVCSVIGFPHGNSHTAIKILETALAIWEGAKEIDMVANAGRLLGGDVAYFSSDISSVNAACVAHGAILKIIFENDYLQDSRILQLCKICSDVGVAFVKTSTGYGFVKQPNGDYICNGATDAHLKLMGANCPAQIQIKAARGVRTLDGLLKVRAFGVTRIGATATESMLIEAIKRGFPDPFPPISIPPETSPLPLRDIESATDFVIISNLTSNYLEVIVHAAAVFAPGRAFMSDECGKTSPHLPTTMGQIWRA